MTVDLKSIVVSLALVFVGLAASPALGQDSGVINEITTKLKAHAYWRCSTTVTMPLGTMDQRMTGPVYLKRGGRYRIEHDVTDAGTGSEFRQLSVNDGSRLWIFVDMVEAYQSLPASRNSALVAVDVMKNPRGFFGRVSVMKTEASQVGGKACHRVTFKMPSTGGVVVMDFDAATGLPRREISSIETTRHPALKGMAALLKTQGIDRVKTRVTYSGHSTAAIDASKFRFTPPRGARLMPEDGSLSGG